MQSEVRGFRWNVIENSGGSRLLHMEYRMGLVYISGVEWLTIRFLMEVRSVGEFEMVLVRFDFPTFRHFLVFMLYLFSKLKNMS